MATVAEIITNEIIKKLEAGTIPWFKPWEGGEAVNYITQKPYRGINRLLLDGGEYITFNQIYDSYAFRKFMKIDFMNEQVPDATTLLKFRHMIEKNHLGEEFFKAINRVMEATGHIMHGGTIIDATHPAPQRMRRKSEIPKCTRQKRETSGNSV